MRIFYFLITLFSFFTAVIMSDNLPGYMMSILGIIGTIGIFLFFSTYVDKVEVGDEKIVVNNESFDIENYRFVDSSSGWYLEVVLKDRSINIYDIEQQAKILCQYMKKGGIVYIDDSFNYICISCIVLFLGLIGAVFKFEIIYLLVPFFVYSLMHYLEEFSKTRYLKKLQENMKKLCVYKDKNLLYE